jgi:hypothetical protein
MRRTRLSRPVSMAGGEARAEVAARDRGREGMGAPWACCSELVASRRGLCGPRCERAGWASGVFPPRVAPRFRLEQRPVGGGVNPAA